MAGFIELSSITIYLILIVFWGLFTASSIISIFIYLELALLACGFNFIIYSLYVDDIAGQVFALIILSVTGSESALGLALLVTYSRLKGDILVPKLRRLKG